MASTKPPPSSVGGNAERTDAVFEGHALEDVRMSRTRLDQRATHRLHELQQLQAPGAVLGHLARAAGHDVLVTLAARLGVERRAQSVSDRLDFLEDETIVIEGTQRHDRVFIDRVECRPLGVEAVGAIVECGRRLAETSRSGLLLRAPTGCPTVGAPAVLDSGSTRNVDGVKRWNSALGATVCASDT